MDYFVGGVAALLSGNVTPNRPKLIRRALTPTKHPMSPNVTPKSELVEDRSIFLSPTQQKKKAIVKKSPKRIFQNPDLDITENTESISPKADKVKKHLKSELEAETEGKSNIVAIKSPSGKLDQSLATLSPSKMSKMNDPQISNENTPKKKKKKLQQKIEISNNEEMNLDKPSPVNITNTDGKSPKKKKQKHTNFVEIENIGENVPEDLTETTEEPVTEENSVSNKKKNNKRKKKNKQNQKETKNTDNKNNLAEETTEQNVPVKKKRKNKKMKQIQVEQDDEIVADDEIITDDQQVEEMKAAEQDVDGNTQSKTAKMLQFIDDSDDDQDLAENSDDDEISNLANPNAITEKDSDSEHDSDDDIESENEDINDENLKNEDESSDDEKQKPKASKKQKQAKKEGKKQNKEVNQGSTEDEIKRTLFVGNVPFSDKCKKEIKKIFNKYGDIETVRIRTVPVKDARVTPKLAVIRNEIHPERSTVNVYVKFARADSVNQALAENNTVLNEHHLRVSRSDETGVEHNPQLAVFLGNLPFGVEDETLRAKFEKCGAIESVRIVRDKKTNAGKGFGYINFASRDGVELALLLKEEDLTIKNRIIRVKRCTNTNKALKKSTKPGKNFGNRNFGNNQGQNRNFGSNQGQNRNFGDNQGQNRNFGNNQGQNRNFGNNQGQRSFGNQGHNRFGNQGQNRNQGGRNFGGNKFGNQGNELSGASRRLMNKRPHQESGDGPPNKKQNIDQPIREKKQRKEFVGMTAEKKKKQKFDKGQKKKKVLSEILTKKT